VNELDRPYHDIAKLFPLLEGPEYDALKADIAANGLLEPIWLHPDGSIIDGRNRHRACIETETPPRFRTWQGDGSLVAFVVSLNLHRRHLTSSQRAAVALELLPMLEAEARERQRGGQGGILLPAFLPGASGEAREQAATLMQTSPRYVSDAKRIQRESPELLERVRSGELAIPQAKRELSKLRQSKVPKARTTALRSPTLIVAQAEATGLPAETVDLIITSPPYNLGGAHWPMGGDGRLPRDEGIGYSDTMSELAYQDWQVACLQELYRVARDGASLFYNHKIRNRDGTMIHPMDWLRHRRNPWTLRQEIIWDRGSTHNHSPALFWPEDERIYWMTKGKPVLPDRSIGMSTVWTFHGPVASTWHPAPFADELPRRCIKAIGREGICVLDPFAGSCTTLRVALEYGYDAIGVDVSEDYLTRAAEENGWTIARDN
jgi:DNA modification methylase